MTYSEITQLTKTAYEHLAVKYHNSFKDEMKQKKYDRNLLSNFSNAVVDNGLICDAGCGPSGHIGKFLQQKGHPIIGIDISPTCIQIAKEYQLK